MDIFLCRLHAFLITREETKPSRREGEEIKSVYHPGSTSNTHPKTQHNKTPSKKLCLHLQKVKAEQPDGSAGQSVVRDGVIAISSALAMEASGKL